MINDSAVTPRNSSSVSQSSDRMKDSVDRISQLRQSFKEMRVDFKEMREDMSQSLQLVANQLQIILGPPEENIPVGKVKIIFITSIAQKHVPQMVVLLDQVNNNGEQLNNRDVYAYIAKLKYPSGVLVDVIENDNGCKVYPCSIMDKSFNLTERWYYYLMGASVTKREKREKNSLRMIRINQEYQAKVKVTEYKGSGYGGWVGAVSAVVDSSSDKQNVKSRNTVFFAEERNMFH